MNKIVFRMKTKDLPPEQAAHLSPLADPEGDVEVTLEEVADFSDIPRDILDSQIAGITERMKSDDRASEEEVEAFFRKWLGDKA